MCIQLETFAPKDPKSRGDCSWDTVIAAIRRHASGQPDKIQNDLNEWANLLEGLAELNAPGPD
jgi:hypothetical protein